MSHQHAVDEAGMALLVDDPVFAANRIVDHLESFIGNFKFLSSTARAHLEKEFEELRGYLPKH